MLTDSMGFNFEWGQLLPQPLHPS